MVEMGEDWQEKAGGLMCVGLSALALDDDTKALLDAGVCGVLLQGRALSDAAGIARLTHAVKHYAARPVFAAVDHEAFQRLGKASGFSHVPSAELLGQRGDVELARRVGQLIGRELRSVGVDVTLGPTLDVASPKVQGRSRSRLLGSDAELVARLTAALVEGQQSEGVACCVKHFPGHGESAADGSEEFPRVPHRFNRLDEVELKPFRAAVQARVAGMMIGHVVFEALDEQLPASLSRAIVFGLLRQRMSYRGMVMLDDIDSGALSKNRSLTDIARLGMASGADCFLCARRPTRAFQLIEVLSQELSRGAVVPERVEAARRRVAPILHRYVRDPGETPDLSVLGKEGPVGLDPRIDASTHVRPRTLAADEKQNHH